MSFIWLIKRFETETAVRPVSPTGPPLVSDEDITMVRDYFTLNQEAHIRQAVVDIGFSYGKIWSILRKNLQWKSYHPHKVQVLSEANKLTRVAACRFFLSFPDDLSKTLPTVNEKALTHLKILKRPWPIWKFEKALTNLKILKMLRTPLKIPKMVYTPLKLVRYPPPSKCFWHFPLKGVLLSGNLIKPFWEIKS